MRLFVSKLAVDPWIAVFLLLTGGTVVLAVGYAALHGVGVVGSSSQGPSLRHLQAVLGDRAVWLSMGFSLWLTLVTLTLALSSALAAVLWLGPQLRRPPLSMALYLPLAVPGVVAALIGDQWLSNAGIVSRLLASTGWISAPAQFPSLVADRYGIGIVLVHWAMVTPFFVIVLDRLIELERIAIFRRQAEALGATRWQSLQRVGLPLLLRGALPLCAVYGAVLMAAFEVPLLVGARHPQMISVEIQARMQRFDLASQPEAYALATLYLLMVTLAWWLISRRYRRGLAR